MPSHRAALLIVLAGATILTGAGCSNTSTEGGRPPVSESPPPTASPETTGGHSTPGPTEEEVAATLAERDAFVREQGLPLDGSPLVAVTPAQQDFIAQQRAFVEGQGGSWDAQSESLALALAADACETSILNGHRLDAAIFRGHVESSPLFATIIPADLGEEGRAAAERNVASVMVFGTGFLCPEDGVNWQATFGEVYG